MGNPVVSPIQPFTSDERLAGVRLCHFGNGSAELLKAHKDWITRYFVPKMRENPNAWIDIYGHTSRLGSEGDNRTLSGKRIAAIEQYIRSQHPGINVNIRGAHGESDAQGFSLEERNNDGYWRAVLIRWFGIPLKIETPPYPQEDPPKKGGKMVAPKGCWCVTGVDTFGLPIKAGVSGGTAAITLLNDKGEKYTISGYGAGVGIGPNIGPEIAEKGWKLLLKAVKEIGLKAGDLQNVSDTVKNLKIVGPGETGGAVFKRATWAADLTINDITKNKMFYIGSGEAQGVVLGAELGLMFFGVPVFEPISGAITYGIAGTPWGFYVSLGLGTMKAALGVGGTLYAITKVEGPS